MVIFHNTDFRERLQEHVAVSGDYGGVTGLTAAEYNRPEVWPWLHHIFQASIVEII